MFLDKREKMRLAENKKMFDKIFKLSCNNDIVKMVEYVAETMNHFDDSKISNRFISDFYDWCGFQNPGMAN